MLEFKKMVKRICRVLLVVFISLSVATAISTLTHNVLKTIEQGEYKAPGVMVDVNGEKMHVYSQGSGSKTIVLLSGYGTGSPVIDFSPLIKGLKDDYQVVVVENFGYGWSDITSKPRTVENIVEETRTALRMAGFAPPYVLMPHSISGIYSLYYANTYPKEVSAVIGIDTSVPGQYKYMKDMTKKSDLNSLVEFTGFTRIVTKLVPSLTPINAAEGTYTEDELKLNRLMYCWHTENKSLISEWNNEVANFEVVANIKYPQTLPVLFFLSQSNIDTYNNHGEDWLGMHRQVISGSENVEYLILPGDHYLHWTCASQMAENIKPFLDSIE